MTETAALIALTAHVSACLGCPNLSSKMKNPVVVVKVGETIVLIPGMYLIFSKTDSFPVIGVLLAIGWFVIIDRLATLVIRRWSNSRIVDRNYTDSS